MRDDSQGEGMCNVLQNCPQSLQGLLLQGFGAISACSQSHSEQLQLEATPPCTDYRLEGLPQIPVYKEALHLLGRVLPHLASLELRSCAVTVSTSCIAQLGGLTSLSFEGSHVYIQDEQHLKALTGWVVLNFADSIFDRIDNQQAGNPENEPVNPTFTSFACWPALKVLHVQGCSLFPAATDMRLFTLRDLHSQWLKPDIGGAKLHMFCPANVFMDASQAVLSQVVSLHIIADAWRYTGGCALLCQILQSAVNVEVVSLKSIEHMATARHPFQVEFRLVSEQGRSLRDLSLHNMFYQCVDLHTLSSLTLRSIDFRFALPLQIQG